MLEQAGNRYFDAVETHGDADAARAGQSVQALDSGLASALELLSDYGLACMPLQPVEPPGASAALVEEVQVEFEKRERVREVLRQA